MRRQATPVSSTDRFGMTLFLALALHAIIIFGVSFNFLDTSTNALPTMEVTLVHNRSNKAPKHADYLAQVNQRGGGNVTYKVRPGAPFSNANPNPTHEQGIAPNSRPTSAPPPRPRHPRRHEILTAPRSPRSVQAEKRPTPITPRERAFSAARLIERSQQIARLSAEIRQQQEAYARRPRVTYISSANARAYRFAAYMDAWRVKVERIGNLNYPSAARRRHLSGSLLLDVAINTDGSLRSVKVLRSSGSPILDQGALRIVHLAAPFAPLSANIRKDTDVLHIIRTWQFESQGFSTSGH